MVKIGFAKCDLMPALTGSIHENCIEAIVLYAESTTLKTAWVVLDFMDFNLHAVSTIRNAICKNTELMPEHVHVCTTHNHGGGSPDYESLGDLCANGVKEAIKKALPAKMRYCFTEVERQVNYIRRKEVAELDGVTTLWYGVDDSTGYDSAPFAEHAVQSIREGLLEYHGQEQTDRAYDPFEHGDRELVLIQFQAENGTMLGSILRFAAHAVCSNLEGSFSADYPWHVRKALEERFGGTALFFNGPCAEIAPGLNKKSYDTAKKLGEYLENVAAEAINTKNFVPLQHLEDISYEVKLPVRQEVLENQVSVTDKIPEYLPERRRYLERKELEKFLPFLREKCLESGTVSTDVTVNLGILRLNDLIIEAFPGETFYATGRSVKEAFPEQDICTVTEHWRTVMYIPPMNEYIRGGYESVCMGTQAGAEQILRNEGRNALACVIENKK